MTASVGSIPVPGIPTWMPKALGYIGGLGIGAMAYAWLKMTKGYNMTALEKTFRTLVVQLLQHIEDLEKHIESLDKRLAESMPKSAYDANVKWRDELEVANARLSSENAEIRKRAADSESLLKLTRERVGLQKRLDRNPNKRRR